MKLHKGFEIDEKLKNRQGLGIVTPSPVRALLKANRREEAIDCYHRAIAIAPKNKKILALKNEIFKKDTPLMKGTVKCIKTNAKGELYGFIVPEEGGKDIYFNEKDIPTDDLSKLAKGAKVQFAKRKSFKGKGPVVQNITFLESG